MHILSTLSPLCVLSLFICYASPWESPNGVCTMRMYFQYRPHHEESPNGVCTTWGSLSCIITPRGEPKRGMHYVGQSTFLYFHFSNNIHKFVSHMIYNTLLLYTYTFSLPSLVKHTNIMPLQLTIYIINNVIHHIITISFLIWHSHTIRYSRIGHTITHKTPPSNYIYTSHIRTHIHAHTSRLITHSIIHTFTHIYNIHLYITYSISCTYFTFLSIA